MKEIEEKLQKAEARQDLPPFEKHTRARILSFTAFLFVIFLLTVFSDYAIYIRGALIALLIADLIYRWAVHE